MSEGIVIDERFLLGRVLRESGPAVVYESKHPNGDLAWIKMPRGADQAEAILNEAKISKALGDNAVPLMDDGKTDEGLPYLVLEPITGERLDHWRSSHGGRAPPDEAMGLGEELCDAIGKVHAAGFAIGILRADAVLVLPKGGICLLELEHAKLATPAAIREDVLRVGRVLYEMMSGMPCIGVAALPLYDVAPELPRAITTTVDDAARGKFETLEELREALKASHPQWLGPPRRPMSSIPPRAEREPRSSKDGSFEFGDMPLELPRASVPLFDPRELAGDSSQKIPAAPKAADVEEAPTWMERLSTRKLPASDRPPPPEPEAAPPPAPPAIERSATTTRPAPSGRSPIGLAALVVAGITVVLALRSVLNSSTAASETTTSATSGTVPPTPVPAESSAAPVASSGPVAASPPSAEPAAAIAQDAPSASSASDASVVATSGDAGTALLHFEGSTIPRLVIVDGAILGTTVNKEVRVPCGRHSLKIGGKGASRWVDLACESDQTVTVETNGTWRTE